MKLETLSEPTGYEADLDLIKNVHSCKPIVERLQAAFKDGVKGESYRSACESRYGSIDVGEVFMGEVYSMISSAGREIDIIASGFPFTPTYALEEAVNGRAEDALVDLLTRIKQIAALKRYDVETGAKEDPSEAFRSAAQKSVKEVLPPSEENV